MSMLILSAHTELKRARVSISARSYSARAMLIIGKCGFAGFLLKNNDLGKGGSLEDELL
jgi:hypothetical protein